MRHKDEITAMLTLKFQYINPIQNILRNLKDDNIYRDCDMQYLNSELNKFTTVAVNGMGLEGIVLPELALEGKTLNEYNKVKFTEYFRILLEYFENLYDVFND